MTTASFAMIAIDLVAISVLVLALYYPKHRRADLVVAFFGVNIGVLAVSTVLATSTVSSGLGLGLFGVLSIIRLRSSEISQREVAYYFSALALGLIAGLTSTPAAMPLAMMVLIIAVMAITDTTLTSRNSIETQQIQLDRAITDPEELRQEAEVLTGAKVHTISVVKLDLVNDLTLVDVGLVRGEATMKRKVSVQTITENPHREALAH
ncbi:Uncharacterised protein [Corynebacterium kutscheri]|uniref:DUF4956 domain-containing protein n=1 Tax=Corynebacterium kutscheri TaxID=35755 RepID=A0A0F6TCG7_9CORY|nr:DUF4956 domain-containing protein [Corynebacterium kutscheri]AKE40371.1 hypothetical protein UL82_00675 [Corynebacterium kutscheri]VEH05339.1 Uncharacterised protein [Corynebacterium kutscheri]VEH10765.1 Uncharacterised protein [Corynebacterium kutscheri]VEH80755.1 Uncharacterised protein [Corynebacterium kutscheri]